MFKISLVVGIRAMEHGWFSHSTADMLLNKAEPWIGVEQFLLQIDLIAGRGSAELYQY